jgi:hypothetical protein
MGMRKILCSIFLATSFIANAQTMNTATLSCAGFFAEKHVTFDLVINTDSGEMWEFPGFIAVGCTGKDKNKQQNQSINTNSATMQCFDGWGYNSTLNLSRNTGKLRVDTFFTGKTSKPEFSNYSFSYDCRKVTSKLF